jgi:hypothetical protein
VRPRVGVETARAQVPSTERRHHAPRTLDVDEPVEPRASERLVDGDPRLHDERPVRAAVVERQEEGDAAHEVRRDDVHQRAPLVVRLPDETDVPEAQVAEPAVDELRRRARRRAPEVAPVDECDGEAGMRGLVRDCRADDPAAHDEQVERPAAQLLECARPVDFVAQSHKGLPHAFRPSRSATSTRT